MSQDLRAMHAPMQMQPAISHRRAVNPPPEVLDGLKSVNAAESLPILVHCLLGLGVVEPQSPAENRIEWI